jgi:hypothetical protein
VWVQSPLRRPDGEPEASVGTLAADFKQDSTHLLLHFVELTMSLKPGEAYECKLHLFGRLPPEVQNDIWEIAIYDVKPRIVLVIKNSIPSTRPSTRPRHQFISTCPIPAVLHTCRASRSLALKRWRLSFAAHRQPAKIFFDFPCDTLFISDGFHLGEFARSLDPADRVAVSRMAIDISDLRNNQYAHDGFDLAWLLLKKFPSLTHLTFPRVNFDAVGAGESKLRRAQRRLVFSVQLVFPEVNAFVGATMNMMERTYKTMGHTCPEMKYVDYGTLDLDLLEQDDDQRRLDRTEGRGHVDEVLEEIETQ